MAKSDAKYSYSGSLTGVTLDDGREVMLHTGSEVLLPPDNSYVKSLVAQGYLKELPSDKSDLSDKSEGLKAKKETPSGS